MSDFVLLFTNSENRIPCMFCDSLSFIAQLQKEELKDKVGANLGRPFYLALRRTRNQQLDLLGHY